jgi:hypothetical protein
VAGTAALGNRLMRVAAGSLEPFGRVMASCSKIYWTPARLAPSKRRVVTELLKSSVSSFMTPYITWTSALSCSIQAFCCHCSSGRCGAPYPPPLSWMSSVIRRRTRSSFCQAMSPNSRFVSEGDSHGGALLYPVAVHVDGFEEGRGRSSSSSLRAVVRE